ncbi:Trithorax group protein osa [Dirofilaria immitis]|nr:Trithorax group protein osa [Dirofilaria immitis]
MNRYPAMERYGQPGPAGYAHLGDPSAAYFYGSVDPSMQGRLQGPVGWQAQGYPPGPAVTGPPNAPIYHPSMRPSAPIRSHLPPQMMQQGPVIDEQQRYEEQQRQHYFHQQQGAYAVQQQLPRTTTPSTLQIDNQQSQGSQSRAPSAGPPLVTTPDSNSRHSTEESTPLRPPSHPQQVPNATTSCNIPPSVPVQQQPSVQYYGQPHTPQMYGVAGLRPGTGPPGTLSMKTGSYHHAYPQSQPGYSAHNYQEGYQTVHPGVATHMYQQQMWNSQQMQRYSGPHANIPTSSSIGNTQMGVAMVPRVSGTLPPEMQQHYAARRSPFCLQTPGPTIATTVPGTTTRLRYSTPPSNSIAHQQLQPQYPSHSMMQSGRVVGASSSPFPHTGPSTSTGFTGIHGITGSLGQSASNLNVLPSGIHTNASGPGTAVATIMHPSFAQFTQPQPMQFPAGSVEATTISQRRRRKLVMKDLMRVNTKRIMMALRSGLETETTWALNALNVMLYDDYAPPTVLSHTPGLLNVLVEHFRAYLSLLYPKVFEVGAESKARTADDENNEFSLQSSKQERTTAPSLVVSRSLKNEPTNFTKISRTGRTVHIEKKELPECLKRARPSGWSCDIADETLSLVYHESRMSSGLGGETSSYLAARLVADIEFGKQLKKPRFL